MGIDLTLLPVRGDASDPRWDAYTLLPTERNYGLYDAIRALGPRRVTSHVKGYEAVIRGGPLDGESYYGELRNDALGELLTWLTAGELVRVDLDAVQVGPTPSRTRAGFAFLGELDWREPVVLYWY